MIEDKIRMCDVLSDIEVAQDLLEPKQQEEDHIELQPHPADEKYATLMADLKIIPPQEEEYKIIDKYCQVLQHLNAVRMPQCACAGGLNTSCMTICPMRVRCYMCRVPYTHLHSAIVFVKYHCRPCQTVSIAYPTAYPIACGLQATGAGQQLLNL